MILSEQIDLGEQLKLIVATKNNGKVKEFAHLLADSGFELKSLTQMGIKDDIEENGSSFHENALLKAQAVRLLFPGEAVIADDSGLEVDALNGAPGIYSARYAGTQYVGTKMHQTQLINKLLVELRDIAFPSRSAKFVCALVAISQDGQVFTTRGECRGMIGFGPRGMNGFGFDPIFLPDEFAYQKTMAELPEDVKNTISHRYRALLSMKEILREIHSKK